MIVLTKLFDQRLKRAESRARLKNPLLGLFAFISLLGLSPAAWAGTGSISATPNPIQVCDGSGTGITTLNWTSTGVTTTEVHRNSPTGTLVSRSGGGARSTTTGKWVKNGDVFYLQDVSNGLPLTAANTLGTVTVNVTNAGCPASGTMSATPNPIQVCDNSGFGVTTLNWNAINIVTVEVHRGTPSGSLISRSGSGAHSFTTGKWVKDGDVFYLQNVTGGLPLTADNTLATVSVSLTTNGCPASGIVATPNPIQVCDGSTLGVTTLNWNSSGYTTVEVHRGSPSGTLISRSGGGAHSITTGKWVKNGDIFYLQNVSGGLPLTAANTLATVTVSVTSNGCSSLSASPNPISVCDGSGVGTTTINWSSQGIESEEIHIGSPDGTLFAASGSGTFSTPTGNWVNEGMTFYLQDVTGGKPLTASNTLANITIHLTTNGCPAVGSVTTPQNPLPICDGTGLGIAVLNWTSIRATTVEVHRNSPSGTLVSRSGGGAHSFTTGKWVKNGDVFYLQDVSNGLPLTAANTLGTVTINTVGCGTLTASPNPIQVCDGSGLGDTTLGGSTTGTSAVEIHSGAPNGPLIQSLATGNFSYATGKTVTDGTTFYLQDVSGGRALTSDYTLATTRVTQRCGTLSADANPVRVCDGSGQGTATLNWNTTGTSTIEVHIGAPDGPIFAISGPGSGSMQSGKWVTDGMTFYLQDVSGGLPLTAANTLATLTLSITTQGCSTVTASPNPIPVCDATGNGVTTLSWTSNVATVELHKDTPNGSLISRSGTGPHSIATGKWVKNGMVFYLQDVSNGLPLTSANTLATVTASTVGCGSMSANPGIISQCDGTGNGITTLSWNSSGTTAVEIHRNAPNGSLFTRSGGGANTGTTGKWVRNGDVFYLQDVSNGRPLTAANTLSTTTVYERGCGTLTSNLSDMEVCDGSGLGSARLSWSSAGTTKVEIHSGSPSGPLIQSTTGSGTFTGSTGKTVTNGLTYYLQDVTNGLPLSSTYTLSSVSFSTHTTGCPQPSVGLNKFDLFLQYLGRTSGGDGQSYWQDLTKGMAKKSIQDAHDLGVNYFRVSVTGTQPPAYFLSSDLDLWRSDPSSYWSLFDQMMADLQANGIKIVPVFVWNWAQFPAMTGETTGQFISDPSSASYLLLQSYVTDFINHYKNHPALYFYQITNELNLKVDLDEHARCLQDPTNPPSWCDPISNITTDQMVGFITRLSTYVRSLDPGHLISSGQSVPRKAAEHLRRRPEFSPQGADFTRDSVAEFQKNLGDVNPGVDIISVHMYNDTQDNERFGITGHTNADLLNIIKQTADEYGKRLYINEFGDHDPTFYDDPNGLFTQAVLDRISALKIPYSTPWAFEFYPLTPYSTFDLRGKSFNLEQGFTDLLLNKIQATNGALGNAIPPPQSPDTTPPQIVITWPLDGTASSGTQLFYAVASDNNKTVSNVSFYIDGTFMNALTAPPYQWNLDTTTLPAGNHVITIRATDPSGNFAEDYVTIATATGP